MSFNYIQTPTGGTTVVNTCLNRPGYTQTLDTDMSTQDWNDFLTYVEELSNVFNPDKEFGREKPSGVVNFWWTGVRTLGEKIIR